VALNSASEGKVRAEASKAEAEAELTRSLIPGAAGAQGARMTADLASSEHSRQKVRESEQNIQHLIAQVEKTGMESRQLEALIKEIGERTKTYGAHINLMTVQAAAERAGIPLKRAEATQILSTLPALISQMSNHARLTGLEADKITGEAKFGSGVGGEVKPWVSMISDFVPKVSFYGKIK